MANAQRPFLTCLVFAAFFTFLFHHSGIGLNLLLFESATFGYLLSGRRLPMERDVLMTLGGTFLTATLVVLYSSTLAIVMNLVSVTLAIGTTLAPELGALHRSAVLAMANLLSTPRTLWRSLPFPANASPVLGITPRGAISGALLPLVVLLFATLYSASNPYFGNLVGDFYAWLGDLDASLPFVFILGLMVSGFLLLLSRNERLMRWAASQVDALLRSNDPMDDTRMRQLRMEARTGALLLGSLNALLLLLNALDIYHVWFHFTFTGQYLKLFVHQGTWLLIISIVLGAIIVLYFFRGDVNFYKNNRLLKRLSYAWLAQNAVLCISVGVRNYWYIHHYALAHKRIGVAFFLLATVVALALVLLKVHDRRSHHFLARWNMLSVYLIALAMTLFDWDTIIARYNMAHREQAFVELDFLATLDDKALPYLIRSKLELENLDSYNAQMIGEDRYIRQLYMRPESYARIINDRAQAFMEEHGERSWREWNLADARACTALKESRE